VFFINPSTGSLTPVSGSPFPSGTGNSFGGSLALVLSSDGRLLFAANTTTGQVAVFTVSPTGALTAVAGSPFSASNVGLKSIILSPDDAVLFVAQDSDGISVLSVASSGALTHIAGSPFSTQPDRPIGDRVDVASIAANCAGNFLFAGLETGEIAVLNIAANGALSHVSGSPFRLDGVGDELLVHDPTSGLLFKTNSFSRTVSALNVSSTGSLSVVPGSTIFLGDNSNEDRLPIDIDVNREGTILFVMNADATVHALNISSNGTLALVPGSPFQNPQSGFGAMLAAAPPSNCPGQGTFDFCVQDNGGGGILKLNLTTGDYEFTNCAGFLLGGTGVLRIKGCTISLKDSRPDRRLVAKMDRCSMKATVSLQVFALGRTFSITDRNTSNNTCVCR
jgi:6-phosphogluconolactonase (cycloisomerase 2 family)